MKECGKDIHNISVIHPQTISQPFYDRDRTDQEWQIIQPLSPPKKPVGKNREVDLSEVVNAIL